MSLEDDIDVVLKKTHKPRAPLDPHHPKAVAKVIIEALKKTKAGKAKAVELRGATLSNGTFKGAKSTVPNPGWEGHNYIIFEITPPGEEPYRLAVSMSWEEGKEYSGSASADLRGTIPLHRFNTLSGFLQNAASDIANHLGKKPRY